MEKDTRYELLDKASISADQISRPSVSYWKDAWRRFRKDKLAMFGLVMILIVSLFAIFGPMLCPYDYDEADFFSIAQWPSKAHWFGTDALGRDLYVRVLYGARISLSIGVVAALVNMVIGVLYGGIAGYFGGKVDMVLMRVTEIFTAIPFLPFAMILSSVMSQMTLSEDMRIFIIMVILGVLTWPSLARLVRGQVLVARESEYVTAAKAMGVSERTIAFKHILPNVVSVILVTLTLDFAGCMLTESSLSYLGFGVHYPRPTWGNMLNGANNATIIGNYWWQWLFTSLFLAITTICINIVGDTLRDVMDPKSNIDK